MFWKKESRRDPKENNKSSRPYRYCTLYISERYKHIIFVPYGQVPDWALVELDNILSDTWPCDFGKLQANIEETLSRYLPSTTYVKGKWPSYNNSKAKSQASFEIDYISLRLETDETKPYGEHELERIKVSATPSRLDNTYSLVGCTHLLDTKVAQIVVDIFSACIKIRS
jgi:hypothetical protein